MIELEIEVLNPVEMLIEDDEGVQFEADESVAGGKAYDYNNLSNKPRLNDVEIKGDMYESDPTVPGWAKAPTKPSYTPSEINAVNADNVIPIEDINNILNTIWD